MYHSDDTGNSWEVYLPLWWASQPHATDIIENNFKFSMQPTRGEMSSMSYQRPFPSYQGKVEREEK